MSELQVQIADRRLDEQLEAAEVKAWLEVARRRLDRRTRNFARYELERELLVLRVALEGDLAARVQFSDREPSPSPIAQALEREAQNERDQPRRDVLNVFVRYLTSGGR